MLIVDCGKAKKNFQRFKYHGSALAFELSSGQQPIFVNCGPGSRFGTDFKVLSGYTCSQCLYEHFHN